MIIFFKFSFQKIIFWELIVERIEINFLNVFNWGPKYFVCTSNFLIVKSKKDMFHIWFCIYFHSFLFVNYFSGYCLLYIIVLLYSLWVIHVTIPCSIFCCIQLGYYDFYCISIAHHRYSFFNMCVQNQKQVESIGFWVSLIDLTPFTDLAPIEKIMAILNRNWTINTINEQWPFYSIIGLSRPPPRPPSLSLPYAWHTLFLRRKRRLL